MDMWRCYVRYDHHYRWLSTAPVDNCGQPGHTWGRTCLHRGTGRGRLRSSTTATPSSAAGHTDCPHPDPAADLRRRHFSTPSTPPKMTMNPQRSMDHPDHDPTRETPGKERQAPRPVGYRRNAAYG